MIHVGDSRSTLLGGLLGIAPPRQWCRGCHDRSKHRQKGGSHLFLPLQAGFDIELGLTKKTMMHLESARDALRAAMRARKSKTT